MPIQGLHFNYAVWLFSALTLKVRLNLSVANLFLTQVLSFNHKLAVLFAVSYLYKTLLPSYWNYTTEQRVFLTSNFDIDIASEGLLKVPMK